MDNNTDTTWWAWCFRRIFEILAKVFDARFHAAILILVLITLITIYSKLHFIKTISQASAQPENFPYTGRDINNYAASVIQRMDLSVNPCNDFYSFACGNFVKMTEIPVDKLEVNTFTTLGDKIQGQLHSLLIEKIDENDPKPFNMAKKLFNACMHREGNLALNDIEKWVLKMQRKLNGNLEWLQYENQTSKCIEIAIKR